MFTGDGQDDRCRHKARVDVASPEVPRPQVHHVRDLRQVRGWGDCRTATSKYVHSLVNHLTENE